MATLFPRALGDPRSMGPFQDQQMQEPVDPYAAQIAALQARMNQPLAAQFTPQQIQQRQSDNNRQYDLGMLGQLSGDEGLSNVGGQVFKQALAARQPKITERGIADPLTGQFNYDPDYLRQRDQAALDQLQQRSAGAGQQRMLAAQAAMDRAEMQRQRAQDQMESRRLAAGISAGNRQGQDDARTWHAEDKLRNDFEKNTKPLQDQLTEIDKLQATLGGYAGRRMDPLAQQSVVILLNKFLDPGSVVREGEFDRVVKSQGMEGTARLLYDKVMHGDILSPAAIQQINGLSQVYQAAAQKKIQQHAMQASDVAQRRGLDPGSIITDPRFRAPAAAAPAPAAGGGKPAPAAPAGVDAATWAHMTPQERALWP